MQKNQWENNRKISAHTHTHSLFWLMTFPPAVYWGRSQGKNHRRFPQNWGEHWNILRIVIFIYVVILPLFHNIMTLFSKHYNCNLSKYFNFHLEVVYLHQGTLISQDSLFSSIYITICCYLTICTIVDCMFCMFLMVCCVMCVVCTVVACWEKPKTNFHWGGQYSQSNLIFRLKISQLFSQNISTFSLNITYFCAIMN